MRSAKGTETALTRLSPLVDGAVGEGRLVGRYEGYEVEVQPARENPAPDVSLSQGGSWQPGPTVDVFRLELAGVAGRSPWDCRNEPTLLANLALVLPARLVFPLIPTAFRFHRSPLEWFAKKVGVPAADAELQGRLKRAGLFDELTALRWGSNPYLPKATFNAGGQAIGEERLAAYREGLKDALRAQGRLGYDQAVDDELAGEVRRHPGVLSLEIESRVPSEERFQELLERALRIARINEQVNTPDAGEPRRASTPTERRAR